MTARRIVAWVGLALIAGASGRVSLAQASAAGTQTAAPPHRALLDQYCVVCHNDRTRQAGLTLQTIDTDRVGQIADEVEVWEKVARKLRSRAMPPPGRPRPDDAVNDAVAASLESALDRAAAADPNPGRPPIHRLNRVEYHNAVRDLLALDIDERALLPPDESGYGFDNIADVLAMSPVLLDRYMVAAEKVSRLALGDASIRPAVQTHTVPYTLWQDGRMSEELPFGSRGGLAVRHHFPLDGEYVIRLSLQRAYGNHIRGLGEANDIELRLDRRRITQFTVGGAGERAPWDAVSRPTLYEQTADERLEVRVNVKAGIRLVSAAVSRQGGRRRRCPRAAAGASPAWRTLAIGMPRWPWIASRSVVPTTPGPLRTHPVAVACSCALPWRRPRRNPARRRSSRASLAARSVAPWSTQMWRRCCRSIEKADTRAASRPASSSR